MPAYVRGNATARQSERLLGHIDTCDDCRHRLAILMRANDRLPALVGPALLVFALGGTGKYVLSLAAASTGAATALGGSGGAAGSAQCGRRARGRRREGEHVLARAAEGEDEEGGADERGEPVVGAHQDREAVAAVVAGVDVAEEAFGLAGGRVAAHVGGHAYPVDLAGGVVRGAGLDA
ncbi:zf-HC2 domain-containing protein [Streptomyces resistomycificus]|uniref:zf-HC2 domain-containing protein n=1 Tax=Streptomyces resistomycificus TaxID=67356 RepID=UPI00384CF9BA